jgi:hypothetical protein
MGGQRSEGCFYTPRNSWGYWKLEEVRRVLPRGFGESKAPQIPLRFLPPES